MYSVDSTCLSVPEFMRGPGSLFSSFCSRKYFSSENPRCVGLISVAPAPSKKLTPNSSGFALCWQASEHDLDDAGLK